MRRGCASSLPACAAMVVVLSVAARAQDGRDAGGMFDVPLRGGIRAALSAAGDHGSADRSQFLLELIRRLHALPVTKDGEERGELTALIAQLEAADGDGDGSAPARETVPLPLAPDTWIKVVFDGRATVDTLPGAILHSRSASFLYSGLLALDDSTREWLATRPDLISFLARHSAAFLVAAPGLRVSNGRMQLPGGEPADPVWRAIVGRGANEPAEFISDLVTRRDGRVAYFLSAIAQLTPSQIQVALNLGSQEVASRVAAAHRLYAVFEHIVYAWRIDQQTFWRPTLDPALLLSELSVDARGMPILPATRRVWSAVFAEGDRAAKGSSADPEATPPVDFAWLCERVFAGSPIDHRRRYDTVLFASRLLTRISPQSESDAIEAARAASRYPALVAVLERAGLVDVHAYAAAARRAARLGAIADRGHAVRALAQFQGSVALIARAAIRGSLAPDSVSRLVSSLSAVDVTGRGDYEDRLVRWIDASLVLPFGRVPNEGAASDVLRLIDGSAAGPIEAVLLRLLAGPSAADPVYVDWEGTRYRVDLSSAEATRLVRILGDEPRPYLSAARALVVVADAFGGGHALRMAAGALMARGLMDLVYATALGQPDATSIPADEAALRHDFGLRSPTALDDRSWVLPDPDYDEGRQWHMRGALLGLDVRLARFSLLRTSSRPPLRRPSLGDVDRHLFTEVVTLVQPAALTDRDRDAIAAALRAGRARVAAIRTPSDAVAIADDARLGPARRTLLAWAVVHEPERVPLSFSLTELLWLGLGSTPADSKLDAWGAPAEPRVGCLCLRLMDRRPFEMFVGRWNSGILASGFSDLNLRLAEVLADLQMPASLLGAVLAAATVDFIENADSRDQDDRRGLVEFVQGLRRERVEEYLALLTTGGPLVPVLDRVTLPSDHPRSLR